MLFQSEAEAGNGGLYISVGHLGTSALGLGRGSKKGAQAKWTSWTHYGNVFSPISLKSSTFLCNKHRSAQMVYFSHERQLTMNNSCNQGIRNNPIGHPLSARLYALRVSKGFSGTSRRGGKHIKAPDKFEYQESTTKKTGHHNTNAKMLE